MKGKYSIPITTGAWYLLLLPVFFVLHGVLENHPYIPEGDAAILLAIYLVAAGALLILFRMLFRIWNKAALMVFIIFLIHFFFGTVQDSFRNLFGESILSRYVFLLPLIALLLILTFGWLWKRKRPLLKLTKYLNILFIILIVLDTGWLVLKTTRREKIQPLPAGLARCTDCPRPDVYLLIMDEYAGDRQLKEVFGFDNSGFYRQLSARGFSLAANSSSNYNLTPYSIASILNMDYLDDEARSRVTSTYRSIGQSTLMRFLQQQQYEFYNYSYFDFPGYPSYARETFFPVRTRLITEQTFLSRIGKEMRFHLATTLKSEKEIRNNTYYSRDNNEKFTRKTGDIAASASPKFVFTHLMMPHYPYYYDSSGAAYPFESLAEGRQNNQQHYIGYLQFANNHILRLVDEILRKSAGPPVILLLSDHGFRHFDEPVATHTLFSNLAAVYVPPGEKLSFDTGMTNVNIVRRAINHVFSQNLPVLRDSMIVVQ